MKNYTLRDWAILAFITTVVHCILFPSSIPSPTSTTAQPYWYSSTPSPTQALAAPKQSTLQNVSSFLGNQGKPVTLTHDTSVHEAFGVSANGHWYSHDPSLVSIFQDGRIKVIYDGATTLCWQPSEGSTDPRECWKVVVKIKKDGDATTKDS